MALKKFSAPELLVTHKEAWHILCFFFGGDSGRSPGWLTVNDRSFAQALLIEAADASYKMSWVEKLMTSAMKPGASITGVLAKLAAKGMKDWISTKKTSDFKQAKIYRAVKDKLTINWRSAWQIRLETDEPVY